MIKVVGFCRFACMFVLLCYGRATLAQMPPEIALDCPEGPFLALAHGSHTVGCIITPPTDIDSFTLFAVAGDVWRVTVLSRTGCFDPVLEVRDPANQPIGTNLCGGRNQFGQCIICSFIQEITISTTGTHIIRVSDSGANDAGSYGIEVHRVKSLVYGTGLSYGEPRIPRLETAPDLDIFAIKGLAGSQIRTVVFSRTGCLDPALEIRSPSGAVLPGGSCSGENQFGQCLQCSFSVDSTLAEDGTYFLMVRDVGVDEAGSYEINNECLFPPCPMGWYPDDLRFTSDSQICWSPVSETNATYDVVRGDLSLLRASGGDFDAATLACASSGNVLPCATDLSDPSPNQAFFYVMRPMHADLGPGSYDSGTPAQLTGLGGRDGIDDLGVSGINTSANACGGAPSLQEDRFFRVSCESGNWCLYQVTESDNTTVVPNGVTVNVRAAPGTASCPSLQDPAQDDWAFDPNVGACPANPDALTNGEWLFINGPVLEPRVVFSDCWARCSKDGGDL